MHASPAYSLDWVTRFNKSAWNGRCRCFAGWLYDWFWIERIHIWRTELDNRLSERRLIDSGDIEFSFAGIPQLAMIAKDSELGVAPADVFYYNRLLETGNKLLIGRSDELVVFYGWCAFKKKRMYSKYFKLDDDEFFIMRCFTRPCFRGRGIFAFAIRHMCAFFSGEGFSRAYIDVATQNIASLRSIGKAGMTSTDSGSVRLRLLQNDIILPYGSLCDRFV